MSSAGVAKSTVVSFTLILSSQKYGASVAKSKSCQKYAFPSVARSENFLFFANLLKNFKLQEPEGQAMPSMEPLDGMTIGPHHFPVQFILRN